MNRWIHERDLNLHVCIYTRIIFLEMFDTSMAPIASNAEFILSTFVPEHHLSTGCYKYMYHIYKWYRDQGLAGVDEQEEWLIYFPRIGMSRIYPPP